MRVKDHAIRLALTVNLEKDRWNSCNSLYPQPYMYTVKDKIVILTLCLLLRIQVSELIFTSSYAVNTSSNLIAAYYSLSGT